MDAPASPFADGEEPVVSPELALVDPVLAAWARERLPAYPPYPAVPIEPPAPPEPVVEPPAEAEVIPFPPLLPEYQRSRLVGSWAAAARLLAAAVVLVAAGLYARDRLTQEGGAQHAAFNVPASSGPSSPTTSMTPTPTTAAKPTVAKATPPKHAAATKPAKSRPAATIKPKHAATRSAKPAGTGLATAAPQAFGWPKVHNARGYRVVFSRAGRVVYSTTTTRPGVSIPRTWVFDGARERFAPGVYRWTVRPLLGGTRLGAPVVSSAFTVAPGPG